MSLDLGGGIASEVADFQAGYMADKYSTLPRAVSLAKPVIVSLSAIPTMVSDYKKEQEAKEREEKALAMLGPKVEEETAACKAEVESQESSESADEIEGDARGVHFELPSSHQQRGKGCGKRGKNDKKGKPAPLAPKSAAKKSGSALKSLAKAVGSVPERPASSSGVSSSSLSSGGSKPFSSLSIGAGIRKKTKDRELFAKADLIMQLKITKVLAGGMGQIVWRAQATTEALERSHKAEEDVILLRQHVDFLQIAQDPLRTQSTMIEDRYFALLPQTVPS